MLYYRSCDLENLVAIVKVMFSQPTSSVMHLSFCTSLGIAGVLFSNDCLYKQFQTVSRQALLVGLLPPFRKKKKNDQAKCALALYREIFSDNNDNFLYLENDYSQCPISLSPYSHKLTSWLFSPVL